MKRLIKFRSALLRPCNLLILTLVNVLMFSACSKKEEPDTTAPKLPDSAALTVTDVAPLTATVKWTAATDDRTAADKLLYLVQWQASGAAEVSNSGTPQPAITEYTLTGLIENTAYKVWVTVTDEAGNHTDYEAKDFTTAYIPAPDTEHYVAFTSDNSAGSNTAIQISSKISDQKGVWIDLNNNGVFEKDIDALPKRFGDTESYILKQGDFRIYGKVTSLSFNIKLVKTVDASHNQYLESLQIEDNKITELTFHPNSKISELRLDKNLYKYIDLSNLSELKILELGSLDMLGLHTNKNPKLTELRVSESSIHELTITDLTELRIFVIQKSEILTTLSMGNNKKLTHITISDAPSLFDIIRLDECVQATSLTISNTGISLLPIGKLSALSNVTLTNNPNLTESELLSFINALPNTKGSIELNKELRTEAIIKAIETKGWKLSK